LSLGKKTLKRGGTIEKGVVSTGRDKKRKRVWDDLKKNKGEKELDRKKNR